LFLFSFSPIDSQICPTIEFDHRRSQNQINYLLQHHPLQFHLITYTSANKQCFVRFIDLQYLLTSHRTIANFKLYDDDKLALVCTNIMETNNGTSTETNLFNPNHQSHLMIINMKSSNDSQINDFRANPSNLLLSYTLKDIPAKLTVDGRRNLIAVVRRKFFSFFVYFSYQLIRNGFD